MNGVLGPTTLLLDGRLDTQQAEYVNTIRSSGEVLLRILNDILDFSKLEVGRVELERAPFDPADLVEEVANLFATAAHEKGIEIVVLAHPRLPATIEGDAGRLRQVLLNLVGNAVKFTDAGGVTIDLRMTDRPEGGRALRCRVVDTGIGVPPERRGQLFEEFAQADPSISRKYGGTGLGLAICKRLVELMGGEIGYAPNPDNAGRGSSFWFALPLDDATPYAPLPAVPDALAGRKAVLVSESGVLFLGVAHQLDAQGIAATRHDGLDAMFDSAGDAGQAAPDLFLVDVQLPGFRRDRFAAAVDAAPGIGRGRVAFILPSTSQLGEDEVLAEGFAGVLRKPIRRAAMGSLLARMFLGAEAVRAEPAAAPGDAPPAPVPPGRYRLLLAEDGKVNQMVARAMLERAGYAVDVAEDGISALHALDARRYDLILMDIHMPEADGFQTTEAIRAMGGEAARTPIVAMTANALVDNQQACLEAGMDGFLTKPINRAEMLYTIARILSGTAPAADRAAGAAAPGVAPPDGADALAAAFDAAVLDQFEQDVGAENFAVLLAEFRDEVGRMCGDLPGLIAGNRLGEAGRLAHSAKSSAGTVGAVRLQEAASRLEAACFEERRDCVASNLAAFEEAARQAVAALDRVPRPA